MTQRHWPDKNLLYCLLGYRLIRDGITETTEIAGPLCDALLPALER